MRKHIELRKAERAGVKIEVVSELKEVTVNLMRDRHEETNSKYAEGV